MSLLKQCCFTNWLIQICIRICTSLLHALCFMLIFIRQFDTFTHNSWNLILDGYATMTGGWGSQGVLYVVCQYWIKYFLLLITSIILYVSHATFATCLLTENSLLLMKRLKLSHVDNVTLGELLITRFPINCLLVRALIMDSQ